MMVLPVNTQRRVDNLAHALSEELLFYTICAL